METPEGGAYPVYHEPRMNKQIVELDYVQGTELTNASSLVHFNNVKPGTILFEIAGVPERTAKMALLRVATKLPVRTRFVGRRIEV